MTFLRSSVFNLIYMLWTLSLGLLAIPYLLVRPDGAVNVADIWTKVTLLLARSICGIRHRVVGAENTPASAIYAAKHQSAWETIALWRLLDRPVFILKQELLSIPVFGHYLKRVPHIAIDRSAGSAAIKQMVAQGREHLAAGRRIIIFPEGTRTRPGERVDYKSGIATLYRQLHAPVVPVALNSGVYWGRNAFTKQAGTITVQFLEALPPEMDKNSFMAELEKQIEETSASLLHSA